MQQTPTGRALPGTCSGDLGRRVRDRRHELVLSRKEVAHRAGMAPGYLRYIEENAGERVSLSASYRLAAALGTTVPKLQGEGFGQPEGSEMLPEGSPRLDILDRAACMDLVRPGGIGRVIFDDERGPVALPINFKVLRDDLVFQTGEGTIVVGLRAGRRLSLEVDHFDSTLAEGWSVLVRGAATVVTDPDELRHIDELNIASWAGVSRLQAVRVSTDEVTGRRIRRHL
ncbi:MAG: helix-turn-helix domain-containing protein [Acidimicrobiales bacterium]